MEMLFDSLDSATFHELELRSRQEGVRLEQVAAALIRRGLTASCPTTADGGAGCLQLVGALVHELRTPIGSLTILADLMEVECTGVGTSWERRARSLRSAASDISTLLDEISEWLRLERGAVRASLERVDLAALLAGLEQAQREQAEALGVAIELETEDAASPRVQSDPQRLSALLSSVLDSAVRVSRAGKVRVGLTTDRDGGVAISVEDSGPGIRPQDLELLFEPLRLADPRNRRAAGGSTIALAVARQQARLLGGDLRAGPAPHGVVLTVSLPVGAH
jgi:signal transduction histidine kinase